MKIVELNDWKGKSIEIGMVITLQEKPYKVTEQLSENTFIVEIDNSNRKLDEYVS